MRRRQQRRWPDLGCSLGRQLAHRSLRFDMRALRGTPRIAAGLRGPGSGPERLGIAHGERCDAAQWTDVSGPAWVEHVRLFDRMLAEITGHLLAAITVEHGERILDVGCGTGTLSAALADLGAHAGWGGHLRDDGRRRPPALRRPRRSSSPMPAERAAAGPFDQIVSRFGVMFFDDPVAAFANLGRAVDEGATLTFVCWRALAENPAIAAGARRLLDALPAPPAPMDPLAPGPMAFADPARLRGILIDAGWSAIEIDPLDTVARYDLAPGDDGIDGRMTLMLDSDTRPSLPRRRRRSRPRRRARGSPCRHRGRTSSTVPTGHVSSCPPRAGWSAPAGRRHRRAPQPSDTVQYRPRAPPPGASVNAGATLAGNEPSGTVQPSGSAQTAAPGGVAADCRP